MLSHKGLKICKATVKILKDSWIQEKSYYKKNIFLSKEITQKN